MEQWFAQPPPVNRVRVAVAAGLLVAAGSALFASILRTTAAPAEALREPGMDRVVAAVAAVATAPFEHVRTIAGPGQPADWPGAWPAFRGPRGDGICHDPGAPLAREWPTGGPPTRWSLDLGEGYAGPVIRDGRVYILDYDQQAEADALRCLSLADGKEIWRMTYPVKVKRNHGMSRTVPALSGDYIVTFGPKCHVVCTRADTGAFVWGLDLVQDHGATVPQWYAGQCPLIDGGRVILGIGGTALLAAVDLATGDFVWRTPNPREWQQTHVSILPIEFAGRRMYVYAAHAGVVGVDAATGELLWETDAWKIPIAACATPVSMGDGRLFLSGGYNAGSMILQLHHTDGRFEASVVRRLKPQEFGSTQQTPILYQGHLYGVRPDGQMVCLDLDGNTVWASGSAARFGIGPYLIADGLLYALNDDGVLTLAEASPRGYARLAQANVLNGHDAWAPLALAGGRLLARDLTRMVCLDLAGGRL